MNLRNRRKPSEASEDLRLVKKVLATVVTADWTTAVLNTQLMNLTAAFDIAMRRATDRNCKDRHVFLDLAVDAVAERLRVFRLAGVLPPALTRR